MGLPVITRVSCATAWSCMCVPRGAAFHNSKQCAPRRRLSHVNSVVFTPVSLLVIVGRFIRMERRCNHKQWHTYHPLHISLARIPCALTSPKRSNGCKNTPTGRGKPWMEGPDSPGAPAVSLSRGRAYNAGDVHCFATAAGTCLLPVYDWSRVDPGTFHHFHQTWTIEIRHTLNAGWRKT